MNKNNNVIAGLFAAGLVSATVGLAAYLNKRLEIMENMRGDDTPKEESEQTIHKNLEYLPNTIRLGFNHTEEVYETPEENDLFFTIGIPQLTQNCIIVGEKRKLILNKIVQEHSHAEHSFDLVLVAGVSPKEIEQLDLEKLQKSQLSRILTTDKVSDARKLIKRAENDAKNLSAHDDSGVKSILLIPDVAALVPHGKQQSKISHETLESLKNIARIGDSNVSVVVCTESAHILDDEFQELYNVQVDVIEEDTAEVMSKQGRKTVELF